MSFSSQKEFLENAGSGLDQTARYGIVFHILDAAKFKFWKMVDTEKVVVIYISLETMFSEAKPARQE